MNTASGMTNPWDTLRGLFTGETPTDGIPQGAADNILLAWPPFTPGFLKKYPVPFSTKDPEFLIQGFMKTA